MKSSRILDIEVLRAFAILYVLLHHTTENLFRQGEFLGNFLVRDFGGWVGVDLFFAISGFVIARSLLPDLTAVDGKTRWREIFRFWGRRALRLMPSAWFWLFAILAMVIFFNESGVFGDLHSNLWATAAGVFNFANIRFADSFMQYAYGTSFVYWSLSLEEQFYILLPLLVLLFGRNLRWFLLAIVAIQLIQVRGPWGMVFRSDAISLGVLLAMFEQGQLYQRTLAVIDRIPAAVSRAMMLGLLVLLPVLGASNQDQLPQQIGLLALVSAAVVFLGSIDRNLLAGLPCASLLLWIGGRSYAIYLIHIPGFFITRELAHRMQWDLGEHVFLVFSGTVALIFGLAELNYRFIETPARRVARRVLS